MQNELGFVPCALRFVPSVHSDTFPASRFLLLLLLLLLLVMVVVMVSVLLRYCNLNLFIYPVTWINK